MDSGTFTGLKEWYENNKYQIRDVVVGTLAILAVLMIGYIAYAAVRQAIIDNDRQPQSASAIDRLDVAFTYHDLFQIVADGEVSLSVNGIEPFGLENLDSGATMWAQVQRTPHALMFQYHARATYYQLDTWQVLSGNYRLVTTTNQPLFMTLTGSGLITITSHSDEETVIGSDMPGLIGLAAAIVAIIVTGFLAYRLYFWLENR